MTTMVESLAGDSLLSLDGDLVAVWPDIIAVPGIRFEETRILRRNTIWPRQDFVILPVEPETVADVVRKILHRVGLKRRIRHIQLAKHGQLELGSYDLFQHVWAGTATPEEVLQRLLDQRVIRSFRVVDR